MRADSHKTINDPQEPPKNLRGPFKDFPGFSRFFFCRFFYVFSGFVLGCLNCVFVVFDKNNIAKCSIESAYRKNKINVNKPISCHLYPVRVKKYDSFTAVNVDSWQVCKPACECGTELNVPVFKFLKDAIVRFWDLEFYFHLDAVYNEFFNKKN